MQRHETIERLTDKAAMKRLLYNLRKELRISRRFQEALDFTDMRLIPTSYVTKSPEQAANTLVWRIAMRNPERNQGHEYLFFIVKCLDEADREIWGHMYHYGRRLLEGLKQNPVDEAKVNFDVENSPLVYVPLGPGERYIPRPEPVASFKVFDRESGLEVGVMSVRMVFGPIDEEE